MSAKPQKRSRESSGTATSSETGPIHHKENGTEGSLTPPPKRVRHNGLARNDAEMDETVVDMELENNRNIDTGPSKSGTATAGGDHPTNKRSRKAKGNTASTAGATVTAPTTVPARARPPATTTATATSKPPATRPATTSDYHHISQRYPSALSAARVVAASSVSAGSAPNRVREGGVSQGRRKPPEASSTHSERGGHSAVASDLGTGAGSSAGSGSSLLNGSKARTKGKGKARASKAQGVANAEVPTAGQIGVAARAESPAEGVSPSRLRRIAESADDTPNDLDRVGSSGKSGLRSSAVEKDGGESIVVGDEGRVGASGGTDWADRFLWKVLPALDGCPAIGVLQNLAHKGMMLLMLVLWYWVLWSFATFTTRVLKGSAASNGGGVQEGVSQQTIAVSLLHGTEEYQSLKLVLESRRREKVDLLAMDEASWANLKSLRERTGTLGRSIQVLRKQAKNTADSRGLPQQPEAMQDIARSQLSEVEAMLWHLKEAHYATSESIAAGQKWAEDAERDLEHDEWRLQRAASAAWEMEVEPLLTSAYQEVEAVAGAADVLTEHIMRKSSTEDVDGYIQMIEGSYKAMIASRRRSEVEAIVAREAEKEWSISEGEDVGKGHGASEALELPLLTTVDEMKHLVSREIEISASGGTGLRDYASLVGGASVVYGNDLTSPSMTSVDHGWWGYVAKLFGARKGLTSSQTAEAALSTSNVPGHCFAFRGGRGKLTVKLGKPRPPGSREGGHKAGFVKVTHISIEHVSVATLPAAAQSAPRVFLVLGWDADPTASSAANEPHVLVSRAEFSVEHNASAVQTFKVHSVAGRVPPPPVGWVTLEVESNHGGDWTCLYGFRIHGE